MIQAWRLFAFVVILVVLALEVAFVVAFAVGRDGGAVDGTHGVRECGEKE